MANRNDASQDGFALPSILLIVIVLMTIGLALTQSVASIRTSLEDQYYHRLAKQAAEAGVVTANHCLNLSSFVQTWGPAASKPALTQNTNCSGQTRSPAVTNLLGGGIARSTFQVNDLEVRDDGAIIIASQGKIEVMRGTSGVVARTYQVTMKQLVNWKVLNASVSASGTSKTCAIITNELYCWGKNSNGSEDFSGQLGNGTTVDSLTPVKVTQQSGVLAGKIVTSVVSAQFHNCALANGKVYCWGKNSNGQLGNGTTTDSSVPVEVGGVLAGKIVTSISASGDTSCAIAESKIYCWGSNNKGTVGNNSTVNSLTPAAVSTTNLGASYTATKLSTSGTRSYSMCAIANSKAWCWGGNEAGQIGNGSTGGVIRVPTKVVDTGVLAGKTVTAISQDGYHNGTSSAYPHVCAVASSAVYCWGENNAGQLGRGNTTDSNVPVAVSTSGVLSGKTVQDVVAGLQHTCVLANSKVYCWGENSAGQLGRGNTTDSNVPVAVVEQADGLLGKTVTAIGGGANRGCAIADFRSYCWGLNNDGQIGDGTTTNRNKPTESIFLRPQAPAFIF